MSLGSCLDDLREVGQTCNTNLIEGQEFVGRVDTADGLV